MKIRSVAMIAFLLALPAHPAAAATWVVGPSLGLDVYRADGSTLTIFAVPSGDNLVSSGLRPGLRVGGFSQSGLNEIFLDTGFLVLSYQGSSYHSFFGTLNYARVLGRGRTSPYVTAGGGFGSVGGSGSSETFTSIGAGLGVRDRLRHEHGAIRVEFRYDRLDNTESGSQGLDVFGFKVGFDLDLN